jgi:hypothetical protein
MRYVLHSLKINGVGGETLDIRCKTKGIRQLPPRLL